MWTFIILFVFALAALAALYIFMRFRKFSFVGKIAEKSRVLAVLVCVAPLLLLSLFLLINVWTFAVALLHLAISFALCDLFALIVRRVTKRTAKRYYAGAAAIVLAAAYLAVGWANAHSVRITRYELTTGKALGEPIRIALIADCHLGITLDGEDFAREIERVRELSPDIVVIAGDFVDDDSNSADMERACRALGETGAKYGVYFVFGNHDRSYFNYRDFTADELRANLEENGVVILEDESALVDGRFYVVGRKDRSSRDRAQASALTADLDGTVYTVMLDHQPNDYENEAQSGADLVLSGHTHGGHIIPAGLIGELTHANDRVYGTETRGGTTFVVTSGISGWAIPFKTGTFSEIAVIDVKEK